ncbi:type VI secretion system baseplate subunit TssF [Janthinobacterium sp. PLB04]|uniref:Type VI secretion system baseplate subunit TssF n=1 Tax=Janthinobacterium lividum TaxID=29581 RepID=A0AAJ4MWC4_9BURK|nr:MULTISPECIES: type VI secretion system baseplate subunit TssF [Janthinobacterium]QSX98454.1 type VI secretion system baseplate subunit TssF [Janthinobacterium lividum]UGQ38865.1 type VI secretion system baseplate subunit TssF [Janthinobacterium sp. PLB04]
MEELLPYYERELGFLRRYSREFSERYPKIAGRLLIGGEVCEDPHIERMIQSFALLNSRISKRLDDDYPEFTEALFEVLYPHYLRPFPSCSIARLDYSGAAAQLTAATEIARGTELATRPVKGVACTFRTAYPVTVAPLALTHAAFAAIIDAPEQVQLPPNATSSVSIVIEATADQISLAQLGVKKLRVFIDGEPSFCAALRDALFMRTLKAYVEADDSGRWSALAQLPVSAAGYAEDDALIPFSARSHPAYRLLTEYFCFPEKFNFFDIDLAALCAPLPSGCRRITLHLALAGLRTDSNTARMLGTMSTNNLLLGCTPVVNLFRLRGEPIRLTHTAASYPVLADARRAYAFEVQAIESVKLVRQTPQGESITEFRPFYSLRHGQMPARDGHYWVMRRDDTISEKSPGYETEISIVDIDFDPAAIETDTLSLELSCTNRDLPAQLTYGLRGGDLFLEGGSSVRSIHFLRKPTESHRFERGRGAHWRLISHLSLNHLSLSGSGLEAFQEMLTLYDLPRSATSQRQISGIAAIDHKAANAWLPGNPFACLVRGLEVRLTLDEEAFVGSGIHAFAHIVECFLGLYVHANSFTQLVVLSKKSGEELLRCKPRSGDLSLV